MVEYTYNNGTLKIKSDMPIVPQSTVTIRQEDTEKVITTLYRLGAKIKTGRSDEYYYAWYTAKPETITVDNSPKMNAVQEIADQNRADIDYISIMTGVEL